MVCGAFSQRTAWFAYRRDRSNHFYSPDARFPIAEKLPDVRIVATFREPVDRLFSLYKLKRASGKITDSFERALESDYELRESSRYCYHLAEWISMFGRNRSWV